MRGQTYRLNIPTLGILLVDDERIPVTIPIGAIVTLDETPAAADRLVKVIWEGKTVMMFPQDLIDRGERVKSAPPR